LGERTGIDLPSEVKGLMKNLESPRKLEYATASFGQGIYMSPIALTRALTALGNGGYLIKPHIVKKIDYEDSEDKIISYLKEEQPRVISGEAGEEITRMLVSIVDETLGEGSYAKAGYTVAAKTGTAQIPNPSGGYYEDRNRHSFFGYFPAYDPQFLVILSINHPKGVKYASQTLSDPFFDITDFIIRYYNLPPDR
jgi:cell division protein FtsI/penicillin-binding protein 2